MSKLHCTFLFSDESEWELFVAKIISESHLVENWFVVDSAFSFKGEFKGLSLKQLVVREPRIQQYVSRIKIIEITINQLEHVRVRMKTTLRLTQLFRKRVRMRRLKAEEKFFSVEKMTRDAATETILNSTDPRDWLFISDVDEILESANGRSAYISEKLEKARAKFLSVHRIRYVFDFDNLDSQMKFCPIIQTSVLREKSPMRISEFRFRRDGVILSGKPLVYEYSYCFSKEAIRKKLRNFAHVGPTEEMFSKALQLNHHFVHPGDNPQNRFWLERQEPDSELHPKYIIDNMQSLKTNNIDANYLANRERDFFNLFGD